MLTFKQFLSSPVLLEKVSNTITNRSALAGQIVDTLLQELPDFHEMKGSRGDKINATQVYQIRIAPKNPKQKIDTEHTLKKIHSSLQKNKMVSRVNQPARAVNSSKYYGVLFSIGDIDFEIVLAKGKNKGEQFENDIIEELVSAHKGDGVNSDSDAHVLLSRLKEVDHRITLDNIASIERRSGDTKRSALSKPSDAGKIIADTIIKLKDGSEIYLSLKNDDGKTIANFGITGVFKSDFSIDKKSPYWKSIVSHLPLNFDRVTRGLRSYSPKKEGERRSNEDAADHDVIEKTPTELSADFKRVLRLLFGSNYIYVRKRGKDFDCVKMDADTVNRKIINRLKIAKIRYPYANRKQVSIILTGSTKPFIIELRNTKGGIIPTQINLQST